MRKRVLALMLALAVVVSLPCRAHAETPNQFYNNVASALGVTIDVYGTAWQDKTKAAYLAYIEDEMTHNLTSPNAIYDSAFQLEQLTGYDIVYAEGGVLYMNTVTDQAGGAFGGVQVWWPNYSSLLDNYVRWVRLAVDEGPAWPHEGTTQPEQPEGTISNSATLTPAIGGTTKSGVDYQASTIGSLTMTFDSTARTQIERKLESYPYYVVLIGVGPRIPGQITKYMVMSTQPISITYQDSGQTYGSWTGYKAVVNTSGNVTHCWLTQTNVDLTSTTTIAMPITSSTSWRTGVQNGDSLNILTAWWQAGVSSAPVIPPATDNTPPSGGDVLPITITWPDISYTGPTYNYEGDTYSTTSGDIDWSPVTDRLDEVAEQFELFASSFESLRSDFLQMWRALGGGLQDISGQLTTIEGKLNRVIDWLINIFNKIPGGAASTQPNPDTDEGGFWDWLGRLLEKLLGNLPETTQDFQNALAQLTGRFPFSVPWDLAAMLGLFAHEPVTPRATFYLPTVTEHGYVYDAQSAVPLTIDCSDYDEVAALARRLEFITFAILLAKWTIDGIKGIDWSLFG